MKKKFLTIALNLILCLCSTFVLGACKEKPAPVAEAAALEALDAAMANMENEQAIKMSCAIPEELAKMVGSTRQAIIAIEKGTFNPTAKLALLLCVALNKRFEDLFYF